MLIIEKNTNNSGTICLFLIIALQKTQSAYLLNYIHAYEKLISVITFHISYPFLARMLMFVNRIIVSR